MAEVRQTDIAVPGVVDAAPTEITQLLRLAVDKGTPVETIEKLVTLYERVADRTAGQEFAAALAQFQEECPSIPKTSTARIAGRGGAEFSYEFAPLDQIASIIRPLLHRRGLSFTWDTVVSDKGMLASTCTLRHQNGHSITASFQCPTDSSAGMSPQQKYSSANTFARRQSLVQVLGLTTTDSDTDTSDPVGLEPITDSQAADLRSLALEVKVDVSKFLRFMGAARLEDITRANLPRAIEALESKRGR